MSGHPPAFKAFNIKWDPAINLFGVINVILLSSLYYIFYSVTFVEHICNTAR